MKSIGCLVLAVFLAGCSYAFPPEVREQVDSTVTAASIFRDPDALRGRTVMLGGDIIRCANEKSVTYLEVLEKPLDSYGRPEDVDESAGRFLIVYEGFLDPSVYLPGLQISVAGKVMGVRRGSIGDYRYDYPLIKSEAIHLFGQPGGFPVRFGIGVDVGGTF